MNNRIKVVVLGMMALPILATDLLATEPIHFPHRPRTQGNMSIVIKAVEGLTISDSTEVAVFTPGGAFAGVERLMGDGPWGIAAWADNTATPDSVDGFANGDTIFWKVWDPYRERELPATPIIEQGGPTYRTDGISVLRLRVQAPPLDPRPPQFRSVPTQVGGEEGSLIDFEIRGIDLNGDSITIWLGASDLPPGPAIIDNRDGTGRFVWQTGFTDAGLYLASIMLSDAEFNTGAEVRIVVAGSQAPASEYYLSSPYPNPFNRTTRVDFKIPVDTGVKLEAWEVSGRRVLSLVDGQFSQGRHVAEFDAGDLPAGMYLFQMSVDGLRRSVGGVLVR